MGSNLLLSSCAAVASLMLAFVVWRVGRRSSTSRSVWLAVVVAFVAAALLPACLAGFLMLRLLEGQPGPTAYPLADGVTYERRVYTTPRRIVLHVVTIDLQRGHGVRVTPPYNHPAAPRTRATRTTDALRDLDADLAVNASYFIPFNDHGLLHSAPAAGERTEAIGTAVGDGLLYGRGGPDWFTLTFDRYSRPGIGPVTDETSQAVSGKYLLVTGGEPQLLPNDEPYPRTAVGFDRARATLWLVVVDGKQPRYSEGVTLRELAALFVELGAEEALNVDGGGSSTLAAGGRLLSRPCHNHIPGRQRPVSNHLLINFATEVPGTPKP